MVDSYHFRDVLSADGAAIAAVEERFGALATRDHVVTRAEEAVTLTIHTDGAVPFILTHRHYNK